jgi:hypothetical protein
MFCPRPATDAATKFVRAAMVRQPLPSSNQQLPRRDLQFSAATATNPTQPRAAYNRIAFSPMQELAIWPMCWLLSVVL